jgi:hypothetical protein
MLPLLFEGVGGPSLCVVGADDCANDDDDSVVVVEDGAGTEAIVLTTSAVDDCIVGIDEVDIDVVVVDG